MKAAQQTIRETNTNCLPGHWRAFRKPASNRLILGNAGPNGKTVLAKSREIVILFDVGDGLPVVDVCQVAQHRHVNGDLHRLDRAIAHHELADTRMPETTFNNVVRGTHAIESVAASAWLLPAAEMAV